jgi:hypothetical protein
MFQAEGSARWIWVLFVVSWSLQRCAVVLLRRYVTLIGALGEPAGLHRGGSNAFAEFAGAGQACPALI